MDEEKPIWDIVSELGEAVADEWPDKPHWTRTPPSEPGWYWVVLRGVKIVTVEVWNDAMGEPMMDTHGLGVVGTGRDRVTSYAVHGITHWWSARETLPPLPESGE